MQIEQHSCYQYVVWKSHDLKITGITHIMPTGPGEKKRWVTGDEISYRLENQILRVSSRYIFIH